MFYQVETRKTFVVLMTGIPNTLQFFLSAKDPYDSWTSVKAIINNPDGPSACKWKDDDKARIEYVKNGEKVEVESTLCELNKDENWVRFVFSTNKEGVSDYVIILPGGIRVPLDRLGNTTTEEIIDLRIKN